AGSRRVLEIIARTAPGCSVNVMGQYRPAWRAGQYPELQGALPAGLLAELRGYADHLGLSREGME
ncbi:MAG: hypothetical protein JW810_12990, partial [Sedimentisphaerales bacterium]|nr:hypothetical protein [Sedimentisphaerales bacterium]